MTFLLLFEELVDGNRKILQHLAVAAFNGIDNAVVNLILKDHLADIIDSRPDGRKLDEHLAF